MDLIKMAKANNGKATLKTVQGENLYVTMKGKNLMVTDENGGNGQNYDRRRQSKQWDYSCN